MGTIIINCNIHKPPFTITETILNLVAEISERIGALSNNTKRKFPTLQLRKENRIKTIQSSLAIENNSLSIEQITSILEGKKVLGAPNEIKEVKNAIDAYELMRTLNPFKEEDFLKAHKIMMAELVNENGRYRRGGVGIFNNRQCLQMAPPAGRVPQLMTELFEWIKKYQTTSINQQLCISLRT